MSSMKVQEIAVGVAARRLLVRGKSPPSGPSGYEREEELDMELPIARELLRLLTAMIPLAEASPLGGEESAAVSGGGQGGSGVEGAAEVTIR